MVKVEPTYSLVIPVTEIGTDSEAYKPFSPTYSPGGLNVIIDVPEKYFASEPTAAKVTLTPEGLEFLYAELYKITQRATKRVAGLND